MARKRMHPTKAHWLLILPLIVLLRSHGFAAIASRQFTDAAPLRFVLHDDINLPFYSWPRTLLSYPVDFSAVKVRADQLRLTNDETAQPVPIQLSEVSRSSDGNLRFAKVCFFADLKPAATRSFTLSRTNSAAPVPDSAVTGTSGQGFLEINGKTLQVRIPASQTIAAGQIAPAPIIAINRGAGWIGDNHLISGRRKITRLHTTRIDSGPLFCTYLVQYDFIGGAQYSAVVKIVDGYSFVIFDESITGLALDDGLHLDMCWSGFNPDQRFPAGCFDRVTNLKWLGIDEPIITPDIEEDPKWMPANEVEDPSKDMAFELAAYSGNGVRDAAPVVSFWETPAGGSELSVFTLDTLKWQDHQYGIWQPSTLLQVHFRHDAGDHLLHWVWPLVTGSRSTAISLEDAGRAQADADRFVDIYRNESPRFGGSSQVQDSRQLLMRNAQILRSWYGWLSLDRIKDMVLTYPDTARQAAPLVAAGEIQTIDEFNRRLRDSALSLYPLGANLVAMDIRHRELYDALIPAFDHFRGSLDPAHRKTAIAIMLLSAYLNSTDDMAARRICLGGTPNMCADGFSVPAEVTLLFPDHPMAAEWREQFQKTLRLMGCYYTRPDVPSWDSLGGRWTESLSVYNWAYFRPTMIGEFCAESADNQNRFANPWMALRGRWMVDELTAPIYNPTPYWRQPKDPHFPAVAMPPPLSDKWKPGMPLSAEFGFDRQYPAHGAHGSGTSILVPYAAGNLGHLLQNFDPLVAEHLLWAANQARSNDNGEMSAENFWAKQILSTYPHNPGTPPELRSCKYTGHGIILRAGVDTPDELSIHLDQVDRGPNYRWGDNGQGACGVLYFYAAGKIWSGHERENTGDHYNEDTVGTTNFGFMKSGKYRDIGPNVLDRPVYDFNFAQFAQIHSLRGPGAYSWPQYDSRSILLVGTDYFALLDRTPAQPIAAAGRFTWFQARDLPFPKLIFLDPFSARADHWSEVQTQSSHGIIRDTDGSSLVLVTHKAGQVDMRDMTSTPLSFIRSADIRTYAWRKNAKYPTGVWPIKAPGANDLLFFSAEPISCTLPTGECFNGNAGAIRRRDDGATQLALFQGSRIGTNELAMETPAGDETGISAVFVHPNEISGQFYAPHGVSSVSLTFADSSLIAGSTLYIDGEKAAVKVANQTLEVSLSAGHHHWQFTSHRPKPVEPTITRTVNFPDGALVYFDPVAEADVYRIDGSDDGGQTWNPLAKSASSPIKLNDLKRGSKVLVRLIASNADESSDSSPDYPIYVMTAPPSPPDGLYLHLSANCVRADWGQVLGIADYRLYRRTVLPSVSDWQLIHHGLERSFIDRSAQGVKPPNILPGADSAGDHPSFIYEYAISSANGNGEGAKSAPATTDPSSWQVWWPPDQAEQFKRASAYWMPPYIPATSTPPERYPD